MDAIRQGVGRLILPPLNHYYYPPLDIRSRYVLFSGNVTCSAYPIEQLDSINSKTGELNEVSALNLIVFGVSGSVANYTLMGFYDLILYHNKV